LPHQALEVLGDHDDLHLEGCRTHHLEVISGDHDHADVGVRRPLDEPVELGKPVVQVGGAEQLHAGES